MKENNPVSANPKFLGTFANGSSHHRVPVYITFSTNPPTLHHDHGSGPFDEMFKKHGVEKKFIRIENPVVFATIVERSKIKNLTDWGFLVSQEVKNEAFANLTRWGQNTDQIILGKKQIQEA